jgi:SAM-dependent methyltransferase
MRTSQRQQMPPTEKSTFYDDHPFDWVTPGESESIESVVSRPLVDIIRNLKSQQLVIDVGCGPGRVLGILARQGVKCIGLDRSRSSIGLAVRRYGRPGVVGDNLRLPLADGCADVVISDGVIHHTDDPKAALAENLRVLKPSGTMYLAVYRPSGRYPRLYRFPGAMIRSGLQHKWAQPLVLIFAEIPYFLIHFVRSKGHRTWKGVRNLFYDYFVTPTVAFLPRDRVEQWCVQQRARIAFYDENRRQNVHCFRITKEECATPGEQRSRSVVGTLATATAE